MKKVLWLVNGMTKEVADSLGIYGSDLAWVTSMLADIRKSNLMSLHIVFPQRIERNILRKEIAGIYYYGVYQEQLCSWKLNESVQNQFQDLLREMRPDIIHIWGTEYAHALDMIRAIDERERDKIVVHIQGIISVVAQQFMADLPMRVRYGYTFRDFVRNDNIKMQQNKFNKRGRNEIEILKSVKNVMGRTDWDKAHCIEINSALTYYFCNESMRREFFEHKWCNENAEEYRIFITQGNYPIKGLHYFLEALTSLVKEFPQIHVRVAGTNIISSAQNKIRESSYSRYIRKYIEKNGLSKYIDFIGYQDAQGMLQEYLKASVYVLPSAIENSPNSLAEALVVGVPAVAANVGGVSSMVEHGKDAFLYQHNDPTMMAYYIAKLLREQKVQREMSEVARKRARYKYEASENCKVLISIYDEMMKRLQDKEGQ